MTAGGLDSTADEEQFHVHPREKGGMVKELKHDINDGAQDDQVGRELRHDAASGEGIEKDTHKIRADETSAESRELQGSPGLSRQELPI